MGRIRTVKPELFRHEGLFELEQETGLPVRFAFAGLFCCCDRDGRFEWKPKTLKLDILPWDDCDFSRVLDALLTRGFIRKYASEGREFGYIPSWAKHQIINNREKESDIPNPVDCEDVSDASSTRAARVTEITQGKGREGKGKGREREGEGSEPVVSLPSVIAIPIVSDDNGHPVTAADVSEWQDSFPSVDVLQALRNIRQWNLANPTKRKTSRGVRAHIVSWLTREQDKGRSAPQASRPAGTLLEHNALAMQEFIANGSN